MSHPFAVAYGAHRMNRMKMSKGGGVALCAHGGPAMCAEGCYASEGGQVDEDSPMAMDSDAQDHVDEDGDVDPEFMSKGGMMNPKLIASKMKMKKMAQGGMAVEKEMPMSDMPMEDEDMSQEPPKEELPQDVKKKLLKKIMHGIHARHGLK